VIFSRSQIIVGVLVAQAFGDGYREKIAIGANKNWESSFVSFCFGA
jgi:hypothetical protein